MKRPLVTAWCLGLVSLVAGLSACATFSEPFSVSIKNDEPRSVTIDVCGSHDCKKRLDAWTLKPGAVGAANVEVKGGYNSIVVLDGSTTTVLGCLPLRLSHRPEQEISVAVSRRVPCGPDGGAAQAGGRDWP